jgi:hypothetical protein
MRSNRLYAITFVVVLVMAGAIGIASATGEVGEATNSTAEAEEVLVVEEPTNEVDTAAVEAYLAELEQQRQTDAYFAELNRIEQEKAAEAQRSAAVTESRNTEPNYEPGDGSRWDQLAQCECGGNWGCNTGNGFGGGLQFMHQRSYSTWLSYGGGEFAPHPWEASREQQIVIAERVLEGSGWKAWPGCSRKFGWL